MSRIEKRKLRRYPLDRQPDGKVALRTGGARYPIMEIRDISDFGISLYLDRSVDVSSQVAIEYADPKMKIEVYGRVAWCAPRDGAAQAGDKGFVMGVELLNPMMLYAMLQKH